LNDTAQFAALGSQWWDENGPMRMLHRLHPTRMAWIVNTLAPETLQGKTCLDVGCGGGLVSESLARLGAHVTGIDLAETNIEVARAHALESGLTIDYRCAAVETITDTYDVVLALEVLEHASDPRALVEACMARVKPNGSIFFSTLNRTKRAYVLAILGAEYALGWLPRGTHQWHKFLRPEFLETPLERAGFHTRRTGFILGLDGWQLGKDTSVNYGVSGFRAFSNYTNMP
jgi:2-polyprenyl-6-hydroxyphenyl methylase / 3-demethylubiquinone-9 3-methyltransferase